MRRLVSRLPVGALLFFAACTPKPSSVQVTSPVQGAEPVAVALAEEPAEPPNVVDGKLTWGELKGRFVFDGDAPPRRENRIREPQVCGDSRWDESLLIDAKSHGVANVLVWLEKEEGTPFREHETLRKKLPDEVRLTIKSCRFQPHVGFMTTGQRMVVVNQDPVGHNSNVATFKNPPNSRIIPASDRDEWDFLHAEKAPVPVSCNIHPWMDARILILDHPYAAVSATDGSFTLPKISVGKHRFRFWHERIGFIKEVVIDGKPVEQPKGAKQIDITEEVVDLGEIHLAAEHFKR